MISLSPVVSPELKRVTITEVPLSASVDTAATLWDSFDSYDTNNDGVVSFDEAGFDTWAEFYAYDFDKDGAIESSDLLSIMSNAAGASTVYVDFSYSGTERGTASQPFNTLFEAGNFAGEPGTVSIKAGTTDEVVYIDKRIKLVSTSGTTQIGKH